MPELPVEIRGHIIKRLDEKPQKQSLETWAGTVITMPVRFSILWHELHIKVPPLERSFRYREVPQVSPFKQWAQEVTAVALVNVLADVLLEKKTFQFEDGRDVQLWIGEDRVELVEEGDWSDFKVPAKQIVHRIFYARP